MTNPNTPSDQNLSSFSQAERDWEKQELADGYLPYPADGLVQPLEQYRRWPDERGKELQLMIDCDGDIHLTAYDEERGIISMEFCSVGAGGGRSPRVRRALYQLADAIRRDNLECKLYNDSDVS